MKLFENVVTIEQSIRVDALAFTSSLSSVFGDLMALFGLNGVMLFLIIEFEGFVELATLGD